uniref:Uncharacterized protein n=1 Tax=Pararge aegeria TaxID=116150 RepID=S4P346_9NEOP
MLVWGAGRTNKLTQFRIYNNRKDSVWSSKPLTEHQTDAKSYAESYRNAKSLSGMTLSVVCFRFPSNIPLVKNNNPY